MNDHAKRIIRELERCGSAGVSNRDIFQDWLIMVHTSLSKLPDHLRSMRQTGNVTEDDQETARQWERLRDRYKSASDWDHLTKAFAILLESTEAYQDTVGEIYMEFGYPSKGSGQFFTPFHLAQANADMLNISETVHKRILEAIKGNVIAEAMLIAGMALEGADSEEWLITRILPLIAERIEPVTVCDPSCGSGVMFLAAASTMPAWMTQMGLVQFYGMDIDQTCVTMCQINVMLYGLNGHAIRCAVAATEPIGAPIQMQLPIEF